MTTLKFTQEIKDKWLARLRDPNSNQARHTGFREKDNHSYTTKSDTPMCCLSHLQYVVRGYSAKYSGAGRVYYGSDSHDLIGGEKTSYLMILNDEKEFTLSQIADYIEANIPAEKE